MILETLLADPSVTDICLNGPESVFVDAGRGMERVPGARVDDLHGWVLARLSETGKSWDARHPFVDATLPTGHRLHASFPPVARQGVLVSLRRLARPAGRGSRWTGCPLHERLREAVRAGDSVLLSGATGSGKTTLASDLLAEAPADERIVALEDTPELAPDHPHFVSLVSRPPNADGCGEVTLRTLLRQALRMRPDRIVLGECRGPEVLDLLQALNTGHRGALATLHASSAREALKRVELLCLLAAGGAVPIPAIRELLALGVDWIAQLERAGEGRRIAELWRLEGREGDTILLRPVLKPGS
jgi:pilus assembly protein CpaF